MKILLLDIETAPNLAHVWGLWNQNVGITQIVTAGYTLCWSAKWLGSGEMSFCSLNDVPAKTKMTHGSWAEKVGFKYCAIKDIDTIKEWANAD